MGSKDAERVLGKPFSDLILGSFQGLIHSSNARCSLQFTDSKNTPTANIGATNKSFKMVSGVWGPTKGKVRR